MRAMRAIVPTILVLGALLVAAGPASAHGISYARSISANFLPDTGPPFTSIAGKVTSTAKGCRASVPVNLWRSQPGADARAGSDRTSSKGNFEVLSQGGFPSGTYYMTVPRKVLLKNRFHKHVCPALKTNTFSF